MTGGVNHLKVRVVIVTNPKHTPSKVDVIVNIFTKGKGLVAELPRSYTMDEHFNDMFAKDGKVAIRRTDGLSSIVWFC
jgi:hypothetical protein